MKRHLPFSREELTELSLALREVREIDDYCRHVQDLFGQAFALDGGFPYCYHFYDGHLHMPSFPAEMRAEWIEIMRTIKFYEPIVWNPHGESFMHSATSAQSTTSPADFDRTLEFVQGRGEFMLGTWAFEDELFLGIAGVARPLASGDFSDADFVNFKMLIPFWQQGIIESARYSRAKLLGSDFAAIIENHPSGLFVFDDADHLVYANHQAKLLLQQEPRKGTAAACAEISAIPQALIARKSAGRASLPLGKSAIIKQLPDWPELGLRKPWLAVIPARAQKLPLSEREVAVLRAYAQSDRGEDGAKKAGSALATYRTHLKNIARKLGVSGSNAALTTWYLNSL